jgi:quercetin dioxygenase-like cupin family protein
MTQKLSLQALGRELLSKAAGSESGRAAQTVNGGHEKSLRQTVIALNANAGLAEHANPDEATLYVLHGRVVLSSDGKSWEGRDGDLIIIPNAPHSLRAEQDSVVLLTIAKLP